MNRRKVFISGSVIVIVALLWWKIRSSSQFNRLEVLGSAKPASDAFSSQTPAPTLPPEVEARLSEADAASVGKILEAFNAPIEFYGKVVDERGSPLGDAMIRYSVADQYFGDSTKHTGSSDGAGFFAISGVKGAGMYVEVSKKGYYRIPEKSYASFGYGVQSGRRPPSKENPAMFVLYRKGVAEPLAHVASRQINVLSIGEPLNIDLSTGHLGRGDLQLESWIGDSSQGRFGWRYRLSIPGGGLVERKEEFIFEAPIEGYQPAVEVNMPADAERWSSDIGKSYFAKLPDGRYARFSINLYPGKRNFVVLDSYVNASPGKRNLEFDSSGKKQRPRR